MKKRMLTIAATAMATMMMASPVMAQDFKIGIYIIADTDLEILCHNR